MTLDGILVSLGTAGKVVVGSKTIPLACERECRLGRADTERLWRWLTSELLNPIVTTIADKAITTAPTAVAFAGSTLTPEALGGTINETLVSLNTAGQMVVGSKSIALESSSAGVGGFGAEGPVSGISPSSTHGSFSNGTSNVAKHQDQCLSGEKRVFEKPSVVEEGGRMDECGG